MTPVIEQNLKKQNKQYQNEIAQLEKFVKKWEMEFAFADFDKLCAECKRSFIDLQCTIHQLPDKNEVEKQEKKSYEVTHVLLSEIETNWDADFFIFLYQYERTKNFSEVWDYLHQYCRNMESKYAWARVSGK